MKKILSFISIAILSSSAFAQLHINPGVDTTDVTIKSAIDFYAKYISEFKGKKLPDFTKYWSAENCKKYKVPDPGVYGIGGDYPTYSMAEMKTVFYAKPFKNGTVLLKSIGSYTDSLKRLEVLYITNNFISTDVKKQHHFITPVEHYKNKWQTQKVRNVTYRFPKTHVFNRKRADSLITQIVILEKQWNIPAIEIEYFFANTYEETQLIRGLEFTMGLGNRDKPSGISNDTDNIVYCAGNGENYFHEVVHIYLNRLHPKSPLNEGLAVYYGGSMGKPLQWHANRLKTYLNSHKEIDLNKFEDFWSMDNYTNPNSTIQGIICSLVFKKDGINGIKRLMTYENMNQVFEKELKFDLKKLNEQLRALINSQHEEMN